MKRFLQMAAAIIPFSENQAQFMDGFLIKIVQ
jgi:hypothetical protein